MNDSVIPSFDGPAGTRIDFRISVEVRSSIRSINGS